MLGCMYVASGVKVKICRNKLFVHINNNINNNTYTPNLYKHGRYLLWTLHLYFVESKVNQYTNLPNKE